jgi:hypothetical protein
MTTNEELQKAAEAAEERLSDVLNEDQLAGYWQERLTAAEARAQNTSGQSGKQPGQKSTAPGAAGRAEADKRFLRSQAQHSSSEPPKRTGPGSAGHAEAQKRFVQGDLRLAEEMARIQRS